MSYFKTIIGSGQSAKYSHNNYSPTSFFTVERMFVCLELGYNLKLKAPSTKTIYEII